MQAKFGNDTSATKGELGNYGFKPTIDPKKRSHLQTETSVGPNDVESPPAKIAKNEDSGTVAQSDAIMTNTTVPQTVIHANAQVIQDQLGKLPPGTQVKPNVVVENPGFQSPVQSTVNENDLLNLNKSDSSLPKSQVEEEAKSTDNEAKNLPKPETKPNDAKDKPDDTAQRQNEASDYAEGEGKDSAVEK